MANHKSAKKRIKQNAVRNLRNRSLKSALKTEIKKFIALTEGGNLEEARNRLPSIHKAVDKSHTKGIIAKNKASRTKSRLTKLATG